MSDNANLVNLGRLVLSRKKNERIKIGPNVWVTLVEVRGDKCRLMIEAPKEVPVARDEILPPTENHSAVVLGIAPDPLNEDCSPIPDSVPERKTA